MWFIGYYTILVSVLLLVYVSITMATQQCRDTVQCEAIKVFDIQVQVDGDVADVTWNFNSSHTFYGFKAFISKDDEIIYESPMMHMEERQIKVVQELGSGEHSICLQVWSNRTSVSMIDCDTFSKTNYKAFIGILAGTIFLVPCVIGLIFIVYKDRQNTKHEIYKALLEDSDIEEKVDYKHEKGVGKKGKSTRLTTEGKVNGAFTEDKKIVSSSVADDKTTVSGSAADRNTVEKVPRDLEAVVVEECKPSEVSINYTDTNKHKNNYGNSENYDSGESGTKNGSIFVIKM